MKQLIPKEKQKLIYLKWQDAHANGSWFSKDELIEKIQEEAFMVEEIGWVVYEDKKEIHLCSRRGLWKGTNVAEYGMYQRIPITWIIDRQIINLETK